MIFDLIAWIYITLTCYAWGSMVCGFFFTSKSDLPDLLFPVICFLGLLIAGIVAWYFSLFLPMYSWVKAILTIPVLVYYLWPRSRNLLIERLRLTCDNMSIIDLVLMAVCILMLVVLTSSPIIHPDSLNYHVYSIRFYDHYGIVPGIANLKLELGFQSLWFVVMGIFDFSFIQPGISFPLNGCFLCWFIIFLLSKAAHRKTNFSYSANSFYLGAWYLVLFFFTLLSWTQIRLTASSASPDFIATCCVLLSFYYLIRISSDNQKDSAVYLAVFFALMAVCIKVSVIAILLLPFFVIAYSLATRKFRLTFISISMAFIILFPLLVRNEVSSGYPLYPASVSGPFSVDWKLSYSRLVHFQHYITGFARYPIVSENADREFNLGFTTWVPRWWDHLYMADKFIIVLIALGFILDLVFYAKWKRQLSKIIAAAFFISIVGAAIWFIRAPDPRFGTGFLIPLLYFQYAPFCTDQSVLFENFYLKYLRLVKSVASFSILIYIGYRTLNFFHLGQLVFPAGVMDTAHLKPGCDEQIKTMMLQDKYEPSMLPDSCKIFIFRGKHLKEGFRSLK